MGLIVGTGGVPVTRHGFCLHVSSVCCSMSLSQKLFCTTILIAFSIVSVELDDRCRCPHQNSIYILYSKIIQYEYNWCIYTKCIENIYHILTNFCMHLIYKIKNTIIVCIRVSTPPQKHHPPLSFQAPLPPLNLQTVWAPLFRQSPPPPLYWCLWTPP